MLITETTPEASIDEEATHPMAENRDHRPLLPEAFDRLADQQPEALAIAFGDRRITYDELRRATDELAHRLHARGIGAESRVAVLMKKTPETLVAIYGIWKAGAAYVPVDPSYPAERVAFMLSDCRAELILTLGPAVGAEHPAPTLEMASVEALASDAQQGKAPAVDLWANQLAYIIYTSGSTGQPKGVMVPHGGLRSVVAEQARSFDLDASSRMLSFSSPSFDASVFEFTLALHSGAAFIQAQSQTELLGANLLRFLEEQRITHAFLPPSVLSTVHPTPLPALRMVVTGGEACSEDNVLRWGAGRAFFNAYGPTEGTVWATLDRCSGVGKPSIGAAVQGAQIHLLDQDLHPISRGEAGELCLGGPLVARGYLERLRLTAEKFRPDPFSAEPGGRLYHTGDLCRSLEDGRFDFLGRIDHQVKVRGFRIELGEIEAALVQHSAVHAAVAVPAGIDGQRADSLLAFILQKEGETVPESAELRQRLSRSLPAHMVPAAILTLETFPLTPNGKVNRRSLQEADWSAEIGRRAAEGVDEHGAGEPGVLYTPSQELLVNYCREALGQRVQLEDNFFDLGGNSLSMTRLLARVRKATGVDLPLDQVFEASTIGEIAALLEGQIQKRVPHLPPMIRAERDGPFPLSYSQERVWFMDQVYPGNLAYNVQAVFTLEGPLDVAALRTAFVRVSERQEVLRTVFRAVEGQGMQHILEEGACTIPLVDIEGAPDPDADFARLVEDFIATPFDIGQLPLLRLMLVRRAEQLHELILCEHHIIHDGWSFNVFLRELLEQYRALTSDGINGGEPQLPRLDLQYADFAHWQRRHLVGEVLDRQVAFWRGELEGVPGLLELPIDRPRPPVPSLQGEAPRIHLSEKLSERLKALSQEQGVTLFMTLFSAFTVVLYRLSHQTDFVVGSAIANRRWRETEEMMGMMVNNLLLRCDLGGSPSFEALLASTRPRVLRAYAHQDVPFNHLVEALDFPRDMSFNPLFQVMFSFHDSPPPVINLGELSMEILPAISNHSAKFDFNLVVYDRSRQAVNKKVPKGLSVIWEYAADLFDATTVQRTMALFESVLTQVAEDPKQRIDELSPFVSTERRQALHEWNDTALPLATGTLPERFAAQVEARRDETALIFGAEQWSYGELDRWVERLTRELEARQVGPEVLVGLLLERSPEMLLTALAIHRAGGAYLPLDPDYPADRLRYMLKDSGAAWVVTCGALTGNLEGVATPRILLEEAGLEELEATGEPAVAAPRGLRRPPQGENLAYVIYTSGSTGLPKGVQIHHRSLANFLTSMALCPGVSQEDTVAALTSLSFDISALELYLPLWVGGAVALVDRDTTLDGAALATAIEATGATVLQATPSGYRLLLDAGWENPGQLKLLCGGEAMPPPLARRLTAGGAALYNVYGPTETTIWSTLGAVDGREPPTLGRPIGNTRIFVTNARQRPVPLGAAGELLIGGEGLARGYRDRPALSAERFIPDSLSGVPGERLYRTGDLVRFLADGRLLYLGRIDRQVKVRGHRIELGEIESVLERHPGIDQVAVIARPGQLGEMGQSELVTYLTPAAGMPARPSVQELREHIKGSLPDYMVPSHFVTLDALPQTPNKKIDRKELAERPLGACEEEGKGKTPWRNPMEEGIAAIWSEFLERGKIGPFDDFFELGGNSLLATRLVSRIRATLGADLTARDLIESRTIREVSRRAQERRRGEGSPLDEPIEAIPGAKPVLSFGQQRMWLLEQRLHGLPVYNMPLALELEGPLEVAALRRALGLCLARHEALRMTFDPQDGSPRLAATPVGEALLREVEIESEAALEEALLRQARCPFDLATEVPVRSFLFRRAPERALLLINIHHIAADGWSWYLLLDEWSGHYRALLEGKEPSTPMPAISYLDFARWERRVWTEERLRPSFDFWRQRMAGIEALPLPFDRPRPVLPRYEGDRCAIHLVAGTTAQLEAFGRSKGSTLYMVLAATFALLLTRHSPGQELVLNSPSAGRDHLDTEGMIGFFLRTLLLRLKADPQLDFPTFVCQVRDGMLEAHAHSEIPLQQIMQVVPTPSGATHPLLQTGFAVQQRRPLSLDLPEVAAERRPLDTATTKFDLLMDLTPDEAGDGGVTGYLEFAAELFDRTTAEGLVRRWSVLVSALAENAHRHLSEVPMLADAERQQLLTEWGWGPRPQLPPRAIHHWFEEQVRETGDAQAVRFEGTILSYGEINRAANRLARRLVQCGVERGSRVGLCLERGPEVVISMLAILKAGGAFVPLDPGYPKARLRYLIEDASLDTLITALGLLAQLPVPGDLLPLCLDTAEERSAQAGLPEGDLPHPASGPDDLAYIMYTSGSTGNPKGVAVPHRAVVRLVKESTFIDMGRQQTFLLFAPISFDASTMEIWAPLLNGGTLAIAPPGKLTTRQLAKTLRREEVTTLWLTAGLFHLMVDEHPKDLARMEQLLAGGDVLSPEKVATMSATAPHCRLVNGYGPTENTTFTTCFDVRSASWSGASVPIGRPIDQSSVYILDTFGRPVPPGCEGELFTGGEGLAQGYIGAPRLTAERFVPDPYSPIPGSRMYRTGDQARWGATGAVEFLGRADLQLKIRGYRIEPGEVRNALERLPGITDAAVLGLADPLNGETRLLAYVVGDAAAVESTTLRGALQETLPPPMIPATFLSLPSLPLTANGKLDRAALPSPWEAIAARKVIEPRTPMEETVAELWREVLGGERVSMTEDFFETGGQSLTAMVLMSRLSEEFDLDLPLQILFETPTVERLAAAIDEILVAEITAMGEEEALDALDTDREAALHETSTTLH